MTKPRVKPLVWEARDDLKGLHEARGADGLYRNVWDQQNGTWVYEGDPTANPQQQARFPTIEAAKAAAQADYEARVLSALDMTPDPAVQALVESARNEGYRAGLKSMADTIENTKIRLTLGRDWVTADQQELTAQAYRHVARLALAAFHNTKENK